MWEQEPVYFEEKEDTFSEFRTAAASSSGNQGLNQCQTAKIVRSTKLASRINTAKHNTIRPLVCYSLRSIAFRKEKNSKSFATCSRKSDRANPLPPRRTHRTGTHRAQRIQPRHISSVLITSSIRTLPFELHQPRQSASSAYINIVRYTPGRIVASRSSYRL